jgi:hypothetical protein
MDRAQISAWVKNSETGKKKLQMLKETADNYKK